MKIRTACLVGFVSFSALLGVFVKFQNRASSVASSEDVRDWGQIEDRVRFLFQKGKAGCVAYTPDAGHRISCQPLQEKKEEARSVKEGCAVTYELSGGRLGDNLLSYLHARWIAYRDRVPLVRAPFPQDHEFALSQETASSGELPIEVIPYFPEPSMKQQNPPFRVDWEDPVFREEIAQCLKPTKQHCLLELPKERVTVCVHVRRGGASDPPSLHLEYPLKFPPDSYYIDQIQRIARIFREKELYVFLMTDDLYPEKLLERYKKAVSCSNILWDCRKKPPENDLDDFFSIPLFDCLILPDSNFSIVASKLKKYALQISPTHYSKKKGKVQIVGLTMAFNPPRSLLGREIELFIYWKPDYQGKEVFSTDDLAHRVQERLLEKKWDIRSWDRKAYRPWLLSWKEVKSWQELKWRLGWGLPAKSPFKEDTRFWVFYSLGPYVKHHDFGRVDREKLVMFLWEPPAVEPHGYAPEMLEKFGKVFTWDDDLVDNKRIFKFYFPVLCPRIKTIPPFEEKKFCALFGTRLASRHPKELYSERENAIRFYEDKPDEFDLYGRNWEKRKFKNWRGRVDDKIGTLKQYKFCICYENMRDVKGYITEKIFDSFAAGCVPVYWGASNVTKWIPEECFIDRRKFSSDQEVYDYLKSITKEEYEAYLESADLFLKSEAAQLYSQDQFIQDFMRIIHD